MFCVYQYFESQIVEAGLNVTFDGENVIFAVIAATDAKPVIRRNTQVLNAAAVQPPAHDCRPQMHHPALLPPNTVKRHFAAIKETATFCAHLR